MIKKIVLMSIMSLIVSNCAFASNCEIVHKNVKYYENQIQENIGNVCAFYNLANEYYLKKKYQKALDTYKDIITLYPKEENAYLKRAAIYYQFKNYDNANREYGKLVKNIPDSVTGNKNMAFIYQNVSDYDNALKYINKAIKLSKDNNADLYYFKADILYDKGNYKEAIENYTKYLNSDAENKNLVYYEISKCYNALGNTAKEKETLVKWSYGFDDNYKINLIRKTKNYFSNLKSKLRKESLY